MNDIRFEKLVEEHDALFDEYIDIAKEKERKQNNYVKKMYVTNHKTSERFQMSHSLQKKLIEQHAMLEQRIGYIHYLAKEKNLSEVFFLTITAPSQYHPFKTVDGDKQLNQNFAYNSIKEATQASYKAIESISRQFYKSLKERLRGSNIDDKLMFAKVNEFHDSFIVHQHMMIILPSDIKVHSKKRNGQVTPLGRWAKQKFYEILKKADFNYSTHPLKKTNDFKKVNDDGRSLSQYMMKYIQKTLSMAKSDEFGQNSSIYFLYGWKTFNRIRHYSTSRVPLNQIEYKKLYHILNKQEKESLLEKAKSNKTNLMTELSKIISIKRETTTKNIFLQCSIASGRRLKQTPIAIEVDALVKTKYVLKCKDPVFTIYSRANITKKIISRDKHKSVVKDKRILVELEIMKDSENRYRKSDFST